MPPLADSHFRGGPGCADARHHFLHGTTQPLCRRLIAGKQRANLTLQFGIAAALARQEYLALRRRKFDRGGEDTIDLLKSVEDNPNVKAVILRVNSPGGTVAATQEVYNTVKRLRAKGKIVTVSMGDIAASGAYYISCAADYIVANPGTLTGSIGVIMAGIDLSDLFKKFGISYNVIKSGKNKDLIAPYRKMTKEEYSLLEEVVMDTYSQFFGAVAEGRKIEPDNLRELADGRIFSGRQALKFKLVDELGDFEKTVTVTAKLSKITGEPNVIDLKPDSGGILRYLTSFADKTVNARQNVTLLETPLSRLHSASPILYMTDF